MSCVARPTSLAQAASMSCPSRAGLRIGTGGASGVVGAGGAGAGVDVAGSAVVAGGVSAVDAAAGRVAGETGVDAAAESMELLGRDGEVGAAEHPANNVSKTIPAAERERVIGPHPPPARWLRRDRCPADGRRPTPDR